jgi:phospholipase C
MANLADKISHIVVLMLENRSFDGMLGKLYEGVAGYNGLQGDESNPEHREGGDVQSILVWNSGGRDPKSMSIPDPDPGELWEDINTQLYGLGNTPDPSVVPSMAGFVDNYVRQARLGQNNYAPQSVMHYYTPDQVPVISQLASAFAVSDQWVASAPCQTWPNRFFLHTGTAGGHENNFPTHFPYVMPTIFTRFNQAGIDNGWKVYFHDFPHALTLSDLWPHVNQFRSYDDEFKEDASRGRLPSYSFIEPRYYPDLKLPNDQHPPHNVTLGEQLIADVYNTLRQAPTWKKTLLVIIYDEHGGCYDHAPPPRAVPPEATNPQPFGFDRYGVRIPAVVISPYIKPGTILRATPDGILPFIGPPYPFDHTSVIATLRKCFGLGGPLTRRDAVAPDLEGALNLDGPDNDGPPEVTALPYETSAAELQRAKDAPLNDFQRGLHAAAAHLPFGLVKESEDFLKNILAHIRDLITGVQPQVPDHGTCNTALPFIKERLKALLGH